MVFCGKMNPLDVFGSDRTLEGNFCVKSRRLIIKLGRAVFDGRKDNKMNK
jgi:hypothetical protein